jgi:H+-transporting ATPase
LNGAVCPPGKLSESIEPADFAVFAGILLEGKYDLVIGELRQVRISYTFI